MLSLNVFAAAIRLRQQFVHPLKLMLAVCIVRLPTASSRLPFPLPLPLPPLSRRVLRSPPGLDVKSSSQRPRRLKSALTGVSQTASQGPPSPQPRDWPGPPCRQIRSTGMPFRCSSSSPLKPLFVTHDIHHTRTISKRRIDASHRPPWTHHATREPS